MSMAHVSNLRRPGEPLRESLRHPAAGRGAGNDRLDELARLIKQDDSFAQSQAYGAADPHARVEHAPNWLTAPAAQARGQVDEALQPSPPPKRRGGLTIAAVVGLAVFGTGAVFAYRAWTSPATTSEPPLINAEQSPAQPSDGQASKQAYARVGDRGGQRGDSREEQPVDSRAAPPPTSPRVVDTLGPINVSRPLGGPPSQDVPAAPGDAERVTTVTIPADQTGSISTSPAPAPPQSTIAPAPQAIAPITPVTPRTLPARGSAPQSGRPASAEAGGYVVQVSSERTEADAQASYRALQAKYPAVLGSRRPTIKRADLGKKGIFFRTQVGPFAAAEKAGKLCNSLKAAGEQCIARRN